MSDISPLVPSATPSVPPDERLRAVLVKAHAHAERNVKILRGELHALAEIVADKQRMLQHEIGAVNAFTVALEQLSELSQPEGAGNG